MTLDTTSLSAPAEGQTPREWLATQAGSDGNALAKAGARGRFGKEAVEALDYAKAQGWKFAEPVKPAPKATPKATTATVPAAPAAAPSPAPVQAPAPAVEVDAKEVRAWAKQNGHEVGERGRIHKSVISAFLAAGGKPTGQPAKRPTPLDMPKRRPQTKGFVHTPQGRVVQDICGDRGCGQSISRCACPGGPKSFPINGKSVALSFDL